MARNTKRVFDLVETSVDRFPGHPCSRSPPILEGTPDATARIIFCSRFISVNQVSSFSSYRTQKRLRTPLSWYSVWIFFVSLGSVSVLHKLRAEILRFCGKATQKPRFDHIKPFADHCTKQLLRNCSVVFQPNPTIGKLTWGVKSVIRQSFIN